jgi:hypothetical protein
LLLLKLFLYKRINKKLLICKKMFKVMFAFSFSQKPFTGDNTTPDDVAVVAVADGGRGGVVVGGLCAIVGGHQLWKDPNT